MRFFLNCPLNRINKIRRKEQGGISKRNRVNIRKRREWKNIKRNGRLQNERLLGKEDEEEDEEDRKQMKKMTEKEVG